MAKQTPKTSSKVRSKLTAETPAKSTQISASSQKVKDVAKATPVSKASSTATPRSKAPLKNAPSKKHGAKSGTGRGNNDAST